jgi:hypothetical protein
MSTKRKKAKPREQLIREGIQALREGLEQMKVMQIKINELERMLDKPKAVGRSK